MKDRFMNIIDTIKHKENLIILKKCDDLLDISSDMLGESSTSGLAITFNG
jgi:hypothetical protein